MESPKNLGQANSRNSLLVCVDGLESIYVSRPSFSLTVFASGCFPYGEVSFSEEAHLEDHPLPHHTRYAEKLVILRGGVRSESRFLYNDCDGRMW